MVLAELLLYICHSHFSNSYGHLHSGPCLLMENDAAMAYCRGMHWSLYYGTKFDRLSDPFRRASVKFLTLPGCQQAMKTCNRQ